MTALRRAALALAFFAAFVVDIGQHPSAQTPAQTPAQTQAQTQTPAPAKRPILITVDDLPLAGSAARGDAAARRAATDALLSALRAHRVPAVAFVIAGNVKTPDDEALLQRWLDEGHEIGSHSNTHPSFTALTTEAYLADVQAAHERLSGFLAPRRRAPRLYRFPYLQEGNTREKVEAMRGWLARAQQRNVPITLDTTDWAFDGPWARAQASGNPAAIDEVRQNYMAAVRLAVTTREAAADAALKRPAPHVLLLHANALGGATWDALFTWLEQRGYRFATADEVLADETFRDLPIDPGRSGYGHYERLGRLKDAADSRRAIASLLETQAAAWNRGDLEAFCSVYAPDAVYASPAGLTRGRDAVLARYKQRYPDAAARGTLSFEIIETELASGLEITPHGATVPGGVHGASVLARWRLDKTGQPPASGMTLIVFRPRLQPAGAPADAPRWEIIQDASF
jgi:peptidoglycan/xylan/chitin deacetylase (PgdA/CDA1 family)